MSNDSRYTNQRRMWQEEIAQHPTNRPYPIMFEALPIRSLSWGVAGERLQENDPVKLNEAGMFIVTIEANATAVVQKGAGSGMPVSVLKVK